MTYRVKEVFRTIQGEGAHAGRVAVFVRFAGCNLWSGREKDRTRDADRHNARCPLWCDTDFVDGEAIWPDKLASQILSLGAGPQVPVVFTGGEPLLQLEPLLIDSLKAKSIPVHVETNGTLDLPLVDSLDWICLSPKVSPEKILIRRADELKVVYPGYDPVTYLGLVNSRLFVQPQDRPGEGWAESLRECIVFVMKHPEWRISMQQHKIMGLP